jgi:lipooligosaccharide transport system permease protein
MGVGIGSLMGPDALLAFGGFEYVHWLGPAQLAAVAMQTAAFESTYPIMGRIMWTRNYEAMLSTPVGTRDIVLGELAWVAFRVGTLAAVLLVVLALFGIVRSPAALLAVPVAMLVGVAFSACLIAFTATRENDVSFSGVFRFVISPLFLFSGTFFPVSRLPEPLQAVAWATPLFHGVELARGLVLGTLEARTAPLHVLYLLVMAALGVALANRFLRRRMAE